MSSLDKPGEDLLIFIYETYLINKRFMVVQYSHSSLIMKKMGKIFMIVFFKQNNLKGWVLDCAAKIHRGDYEISNY